MEDNYETSVHDFSMHVITLKSAELTICTITVNKIVKKIFELLILSTQRKLVERIRA